VVGPEVMMRFTVRALMDRGIAEERIFVSLERNMRCGLGHCGHCQLGPTLICRDGSVYSYAAAEPWLEVREL
jgi:anaerobic sulfite reductase subunit B